MNPEVRKAIGRPRSYERTAAAYGWPADVSKEDALAKLFALNQERAKKQAVE